jgi:hypothetical protein
MMKTEIKKMFREDGTLVQLIDFLKQLPENDWVWSFLEFDGIGIAPNNLSMNEFEELIRADATGFKMNWHELLQFAESIQQTINCLLVAVKEINDLQAAELDADNFSSCEIVIQAFDSTEWELTTI